MGLVGAVQGGAERVLEVEIEVEGSGGDGV